MRFILDLLFLFTSLLYYLTAQHGLKLTRNIKVISEKRLRLSSAGTRVSLCNIAGVFFERANVSALLTAIMNFKDVLPIPQASGFRAAYAFRITWPDPRGQIHVANLSLGKIRK